MDIVDAITAAVDGRCACGCGARITDRSPSAWFATEGCQDRWTAKERGQPPAPPPFPGTPAAPQPVEPDADSQPLRILFRQGYRLALPGTSAPWMRRCDHCGAVDTPEEGRRALPAFFDPWDETTTRAEYESCNVCPACSTPTPGPYLVALWRHIHPTDVYRLLLLHGERYSQYEVSGYTVRPRSHDRRGLVETWRRVERHLLRDLAPRCEHTSGCTESAADRYELRMPIHWLGNWHTPGRALLLCGRHSAELMRHVFATADPVLGPYATMPTPPYQRERLDWTQL